MARINIEDSLFKDGAFLDLAIAMGSRHAALGAVIEAFIIAQEFYLNESTNRLIPLTEWKRRKAVGLVIDCGFAELKGENKDFVYVRGSEKQFGWLLQRQEAGQKGGRPKNDNSSNQNKPIETKAEESGRLSEQSGSNPLTLPLSSFSNSNSNSNSLIPVVESADRLPTKKQIQHFKVSKPSELSSILPNSAKENYLELYGDQDFIKREFYKMQNWLLANPKKNNKSQKGWIMFVNNWLESGWPKYQQTIQSNKPKASSVDELMNFMGWDNA